MIDKERISISISISISIGNYDGSFDTDPNLILIPTTTVATTADGRTTILVTTTAKVPTLYVHQLFLSLTGRALLLLLLLLSVNHYSCRHKLIEYKYYFQEICLLF